MFKFDNSYFALIKRATMMFFAIVMLHACMFCMYSAMVGLSDEQNFDCVERAWMNGPVQCMSLL